MRLALPSSSALRWACRGALAGYAALLATGLLSPSGPAGVAGSGLLDLQDSARIATVAGALGAAALLEVAGFVPVGILALLSAPRPPSGRSRAGAAVGTAAGASLLVVIAVAVVEIGWPWQLPGSSDLILPVVGSALGIGGGVLGWGDRAARLTALLVLGVPLVAAPALLGLAVLAAAEPEPLVPASPTVTSEDKRRLYAILRRANPTALRPDQRGTVTLATRDIDLLLAWGLPVVLGAGRLSARVELGAADRANLAASLRLPRLGGAPRYLNVVAGARVTTEGERVGVAEPRLRLGRVSVPAGLSRGVASVLAALVRADRRARPLLAGVRGIEVAPDRLTVSYGRIALPPDLLAGMVWGEGSADAVREAVRAHLKALLDAVPRLPPGEARLGAAVERAFATARERAHAGPAVQENRAAVLALGILLGHGRLERLVGEVMGPADWRRAAPLARTTLRGRTDWTRHFFVSAALTAISAQAPSDAAGLFKEELDAGGGSGFSFADLLADRAGTTFALLATHDEARARALQERLAAGFRVDDFFPEAAGLPENIPDAELRSRYGGVDGPLFRRYAAEVERRLWSCPAYRELAPTSRSPVPGPGAAGEMPSRGLARSRADEAPGSKTGPLSGAA